MKIMSEKMSPRILFDTLNYAKLLKDGGVEKADSHATALVTVLSHNIYTKDEVDMRFERALHHFEKTLDHRLNALEVSQRELELRVEKAINRNFISTVSVLGGLMAILQVAAIITHAIWH